MKLQRLLNNYKDKVYNGIYDYILFFEETNEIIYIYHQEDGKQVSINKSISDLLFYTTFLSLLERVKSPNEILVRTEFEGLISPLGCNEEGLQIRCYGNTYQYHKINLVLLNSDKEKVEYIENNTI